MAFRNRIVRLSQLVADQIIGATIATASSGARWVIGQGPGGYTPSEIYAYTGGREETQPANIRTQYVQIGTPAQALDSGELVLQAPQLNNGGTRAELHLSNNGAAGHGNAVVYSDEVHLNGNAGAQPHVFFGDYDQCWGGGMPALAGVSPPAGTPRKIIVGTAVGAVNALGNIGVTFNDGGFPNGCLLVMCTSGDANAYAGTVTPYQYGLPSVNVACRNPTPANGATVRINYIAFGW